jgi:hypothetical protein
MAGVLTPTEPRGLRGLIARERLRRAARIERRIRTRRARRDPHEPRCGEVRARRYDALGRLDAECLQRDLAVQLLRWSRCRSVRLVDVMVPAVEAQSGVRFVAPARDAGGRVLFIHCLVGGGVWWRPGVVIVQFTVMEQHPFSRLVRDA